MDPELDRLMPNAAQLQRIVSDSRQGLKIKDPSDLKDLNLNVYDVSTL